MLADDADWTLPYGGAEALRPCYYFYCEPDAFALFTDVLNPSEKIEIINTGSMALSSQKICNVIYNGSWVDTEKKDFTNWKSGSPNQMNRQRYRQIRLDIQACIFSQKKSVT